MTEEKITRDFETRCESLKVTYNTGDPSNPKESAALYCVFKYYVGGGRTDALYYKAIFRHKSRIVHREEYRTDMTAQKSSSLGQYGYVRVNGTLLGC
jgi:hypothetical protein